MGRDRKELALMLALAACLVVHAYLIVQAIRAAF